MIKKVAKVIWNSHTSLLFPLLLTCFYITIIHLSQPRNQLYCNATDQTNQFIHLWLIKRNCDFISSNMVKRNSTQNVEGYFSRFIFLCTCVCSGSCMCTTFMKLLPDGLLKMKSQTSVSCQWGCWECRLGLLQG